MSDAKWDFFKPNKHKLDEELENQPKYVFEYCMEVADAEEKLSRAETKLELLEAEVGKEVRERPNEFGLDKITVESVKSTIILDKRVQKQKDLIIEWKHDVAVFKGAVNALSHRKMALEQLCYLHGADYFSKPKLPKMEEEDKKNIRKSGQKRRED